MNIGKILLLGAIGGSLALLLRSKQGKQLSKDVLDKTKDLMSTLQKASKDGKLWSTLKRQVVTSN